ncbi:MAG: hypothetical protein M1819_003361 [Sarea resinae]|nr:MAG: hypothetical protein M1819_003361 [Sarea resinae]
MIDKDRPLTHINKKGRPVSQCTHCRGLRKSRAAHVKCDCGEKTRAKGPCTHLDKTDTKSETPACSCNHGAKCTCSVKKEQLDPVFEFDGLDSASSSSAELRKPRLPSVQSETSLTVFANGHHKPVHKHNHMAHKCGAPYTIPRSHTIHGSTELSRHSSGLSGNFADLMSSRFPGVQDSRLIKSECASPEMRGVSRMEQLNDQLPPLDLAFPSYNNSAAASQTQLDSTSVPDTPFDNYLATPDMEQAMFSAGLCMPVDWSALDLPLDNEFSADYSQAPSYASFDYNNLSQAGLTAPSSGEVSEAGDFVPLAESNPLNTPSLINNQFASDSSELCESDSNRLSAASSYIGLSQVSMLASENLESLDIDDFLRDAAAGTSFDPNVTLQPESRPFSGAGYRSNEALKMAPRSVPTDDMGLVLTHENTDAFNSSASTPYSQGASGPFGEPERDILDPSWNS